MSHAVLAMQKDIEKKVNARALRSSTDSPTSEYSELKNVAVGKIVQKEHDAVAPTPSVEQQAGAFYMKVADTSDLQKTWSVVENALEALPSTDFAPTAGEFSAHSVQYHQDGFMMARSRFCLLENKGDEDVFLEVSKLTGNGFIFQDQFIAALQGSLQEGFQAIQQLEQPAALEEAETSNLAFLDLSEQSIGYPMIEKWLTSLQPKKEVQYDQMVVYESLSTLAWNLNDSNNFKVLAEYKNDIVAHVLDILKVEETTSVPTGYFAAKVLEKFFAQDSAVPDKLKVWDTVSSLEESITKWSTPNPKALHKEVPCSRGVVTTLLSVLRNAADMMTGEPSPAILKKSSTFVNELSARMQTTKASWPADCSMEELCKALRVNNPAGAEEEVLPA